MSQLPNNYNLEERTAKFGENTIIFCKNVVQDAINKPLINQLIRSSTSIGGELYGGEWRQFSERFLQ